MILLPDTAVDISPLSAVASVFAGLAVLISVVTLVRGALGWASGRVLNDPESAVTGRKRAFEGLAGALVAGMIGAWLAGLLAFGSTPTKSNRLSAAESPGVKGSVLYPTLPGDRVIEDELLGGGGR